MKTVARFLTLPPAATFHNGVECLDVACAQGECCALVSTWAVCALPASRRWRSHRLRTFKNEPPPWAFVDDPTTPVDGGAVTANRPALARGRRLRRGAVHGALFVVSLLLIWFALRKVDFAQVPTYLGRLDAITLTLALAAYVVAWGLRVARLHFLAHMVAIPIALPQAALTAFGANALNIVAPARLGDVAAFMHLRALYGRGAAAAAAIMTWRVGDLGALLVLGLLAGPAVLLLVPVGNASTGLLWLMAGGLVFLVLAGAAIYLAKHHQFRALLDRITKRLLGTRAPTGADFGRATATLWTPRVFIVGLILASGAWLADVALAGIILDALWLEPLRGGRNPYLLVLIPVILANAAKALPTTPGSIGVYEVVFAVALNQYVGDAASAAIFGFTAVAVHLFVNALTLALGLPGAVAIGRSTSRLVAR